MASKESLQPKLLYATTVDPQTTKNQRLNLVINDEYRFVAVYSGKKELKLLSFPGDRVINHKTKSYVLMFS